MNYLIQNGRVIDPANKVDEIADVLIEGGKVSAVGKGLGASGAESIDAKGKIIAPGLVDMHAHLREPGREDKETVRTGTCAALRGGFTTVACMPNTEPALDNVEIVRALQVIIRRDALCNVAIVGAITEGRAGKKLTDIAGLKEAGVVALSDDGASVEDGALMLEALKKARASELLVIAHCEDTKLSGGGVINKGFISTKMGLRGISRESEYAMVKRDIELAKKAQGAIHIAHVSCRESVEIIRQAKKDGARVTAETAPHYFTLTEDCCVTYDTNTKMNPPLRTKDDVAAIKEGLADGTIDAIATDHAPHTDSEKDVEFDHAPFGIIGLETALSLTAMELVASGVLSWSETIARLSANPARILGIGKGGIAPGAPADLIIIDPDKEYVYARESIASKSKNSPFVNWRLKACVTHAMVGGKIMLEPGHEGEHGEVKACE